MPTLNDLSSGFKLCKKCNTKKPLSEFHRSFRDRPDTYLAYCKVCISKYAKDNKERLKVPCPVCGVPISRKGKTCRKCYHKSELGQQRHKSMSDRRKALKKDRLCVDCGVKIHRQSTRCMKCKSDGEHNANWDGGKSSMKKRIISSLEYRQWRSDVFTRDSFTCGECNKVGGKLHAHHIVRFGDIVNRNNVKTVEDAINCSELWNINNGQTLCVDCHNNLHKTKGYFYGKHSER